MVLQSDYARLEFRKY
ncbi:lipocalin-like domain-containing protein [Bacteroides fragilis]|nr:lipocalin-like domain-containing protein [Bacteroides fragilis]